MKTFVSFAALGTVWAIAVYTYPVLAVLVFLIALAISQPSQ
jgi:hypothetical protein